jgi:hypothetical protein
MKSMIAYDEKNDVDFDYGLLFTPDGRLTKPLYHLDENDATAPSVIALFIGADGNLTDSVSNTLSAFITAHQFPFTSDIVRLYYANIGRSVTHCSIAEFWR